LARHTAGREPWLRWERPSIPKPTDTTGVFSAVHDAWDRLVEVKDGANTVANYEYDGFSGRIVKETYTAGSLSETRHYYVSSAWRVLEERVGSSTSPDRQYLWGRRYVDELIFRDRDTDANGTLDERLYALQDGNFNVTTIMRYLTLRYLALALPLIACCLLSGCGTGWTEDNITVSQARGDRIAVALEAYKRDHAEYPTALDALVPGYLAAIEPPTAGDGVWHYRRRDFKDGGQGFDLVFGGPSRYDPESGRTHVPDGWSIDTK
jgi:YD repeat-containing protein